MATMPALIGFSLDYANIQLTALGVTPSIIYQTAPTTGTTPDLVQAQSPNAGQTISGAVTLTLSGIFKLPKVGVTVFNPVTTLISSTT